MWSPQQYRKIGLQQAVDETIIELAVNEIDFFLDQHPKLPAILTLGHLACRSNVPWFELRSYVNRQRFDHYIHFRIRKRSGGSRQISVPEYKLMRVQRWIAQHILSALPVHRASYAFSPGSSIFNCVMQHCGARWLIKLDISGFFGSISEIQVYRVFQEAGYVPLVAFELARLCTHAPTKSTRYESEIWLAHELESIPGIYQQRHIGYLPQGAPTSPMLSNLVMYPTDKLISSLAKKHGLVYTRYSDDITLSTANNFSRSQANKLIREISAILRCKGLTLNDSKTKIIPPGARKIVLGLVANASNPGLTREFRDRLRQHIYYLEKFGPEAHRKARKFDTVSGLYRHIHGLISFAQSVDSRFSDEIKERFRKIEWNICTDK